MPAPPRVDSSVPTPLGLRTISSATGASRLRTPARWVGLLGLCLAGTPLHAASEPPRPTPSTVPGELTVSLGLARGSYWSFFRSTSPAYMLELTARYSPADAAERPWRLVGGLRAGPSQVGSAQVPLEIFARAELVAPLGSWTPGVGLELGGSGLAAFSEGGRRGAAQAVYQLEAGRIGPPYLAVHALPLTFSLGQLHFSALELQIGTSIWPTATVTRLTLGLLSVGGAL